MNRAYNHRSFGVLAGVVAGVLAGVNSAHAYLGSFENADGYQPFLNMVQNYNAGHYGPNSGYGGGPSAITPNTDFWTAVQGGFFTGGNVSYATGHQNFDRQWVNNGIGAASNQALQLTTAHMGWNQPALEYTYNLDAPDLGGVTPSSTGNSTVNLSFWWRGSLAGSEILGFVPEGYFGHAVQFRDSSNTVGFEVGMTQRATGDHVTLWNGSTLFETTIPAPALGRYDRWDISLDLANDTFSASYFQFLTSTTTTLATNQPMMSAMSNLTSLDFRTSPGVTNDKGRGLAVDDFHFSPIPEPTTVGAIGLISAAMLLKRPKRA